MTRTSARRQRGVSLLEALIAFLVFSLGLLAIARVQAHLRVDAELARQRSEAVRLAQAEIESLRAFTVLTAASGVRSFAAVVDATSTVDASSGYPTNTVYQLVREVAMVAGLQAKSLRVSAIWSDRRGDAHEVVLASTMAGVAPALGGTLGLQRGISRTTGTFGRSIRIPLAAKDLGDGRSAMKPNPGASVAFVFDNTSGALTARCTVDPAIANTELTAAALGSCDAVVGHLVSGIVRFSSASPPDPAQAADPPLPFSVVVQMKGSPAATPASCDTELVSLPGGDRFVAYRCAVYPQPGGSWSGRVVLVPAGWTIGGGAADRRICRYSADLDGSGAVDVNREHPEHYTDVDSSLAHQNFLVVGGSASCPIGAPVQVTGNNGDVPADLSTAQHQP